MAQRYEPPKQSGVGQLVDSVLLMVFVFGSLMFSLFYENILGFLAMGADEADAAAATGEVTWESLGQNEVMQAQWEKLGYGVEEAAVIGDAVGLDHVAVGERGLEESHRAKVHGGSPCGS